MGELNDGKDIIQEFETLRRIRTNWNDHWKEIAERIWPMQRHRFNFNGDLSTQGDKRNEFVFDSTGIQGLGKFGAILDSLLTPRNSFWHQMKPDNQLLSKNKSVQDYFERVNNILFERRYAPAANFSSNNQGQYKSLGAYGTGGMFIDDVFGKEGLRYRNIHLSELYLRENHQGLIDTVFRHFSLTAHQAIKVWGEELPETIVQKGKTDPESRFFFIHKVADNDEQDPSLKDFRGMPFSSHYVSIEGNKIVEHGGFSTFPYAISRFEQESLEVYGRSPAMDALPAIKTLNEQKKTLLKQGHLATDPIILANDDGIIDLYDGTPGSLIPGGVNKDGRPLVHALPSGNVAVGKDLMDDERALINDSFLVSLFQILVETPTMTATEVLERTREKGILLAPTVGRQQSEYLGPMIEREIDILSRQGLLPDQPQILKDAAGEFKIIYDSPLSRTQKAEWAAGAMRTVQQLLEVSVATGDPSLMDYINWDVAAPQIADIHGTPSLWLNGEDAIRNIRRQRAAAQQRQQAIEAAPAAAGLAKAAQ